ncbi:MAG: short-chain dehydrogenase [Bacteroidota bacterium]
MTNDVIGKYIESKDVTGRAVNIFFKQRNAIMGLFVQWKDYEEMKTKNFWRIVPESKIEEWKKTKDPSLAKLFSGSDFTKLK